MVVKKVDRVFCDREDCLEDGILESQEIDLENENAYVCPRCGGVFHSDCGLGDPKCPNCSPDLDYVEAEDIGELQELIAKIKAKKK